MPVIDLDRLTRRLSPLERGVIASLGLHLFVWILFSWEHRVRIADEAVSALEIDLSRPFRITSDPALARRTENPGAGAPVVEKPTPFAGQGVAGGAETPAPDAKGAAQDWVLPTDKTKVEAPPELGGQAGDAEGKGEGAGLGGLGGEGDGEVDWVYLTDLPRLLNRAQLLRDIRRFYPAVERAADREGRVALDVHINAEGRVVSVTVAESAGPLFDEAARKVLSQSRFSPARIKDKTVPVKVRQAIEFRLEM